MAQTRTASTGEPISQDGVTYRHFSPSASLLHRLMALERWLSQHVAEFDLVHIHALFFVCRVAGGLLGRAAPRPYMVRPLGTLNTWGMTHRRPWLKRLSFRLLESRILKHAALVHYTSDQERREAGGLFVGTRSTVVPNPVAASLCSQDSVRLDGRMEKLNNREVIVFLNQ